MEDEVDRCSVEKKYFEIEKKQLLINNDRLLEEDISCDVMCAYLRSLNRVDNCESVLVLQEKSIVVNELKQLLSILKEKSHMTLCEPSDVDSRFKKIKDENVSLAFQVSSLFIPKVVKKNDLSKTVTSHLHTNKKIIEKCTKFLASILLKIEFEPINAYFRNNKDVHRDYLRVNKRHVETLHELLEEARALKPLDEHIGHASKFVERIQELLVYVSASCPFTESENEK
ncbi:hypothetical protein Tco_0600117 [Tanacetum coccineum]|uniref:Uncharacterized protein n=1 Tax=Tanacetum coccineum TaxID=301880 RepID=A0ABQ4WAW1_9ASTR